MNKGITLIILGVILSAMSMVFYAHLGSEPAPQVADTTTGTPVSTPGTVPLAEADVPVTTPAGKTLPPVTQKPATPPAQATPPVAPAQTKPAQTQPVLPQKPVEPVLPPAEKPAEKPADKPAGTTPPEPQEPTAVKPSGVPELLPLDTPPSNPTPVETPPAAVTKPDTKPAPEVAGAAPVLTPLDSLSKDGKHTMKALGLHFSGSKILLRLEATSAFPFKTFSLTGPDRLVVDLPGTWTGLSAPAIPGNKLVTGIRIGNQPAGPRLVLDLSRKAKTTIQRISDTIVEIILE